MFMENQAEFPEGQNPIWRCITKELNFGDMTVSTQEKTNDKGKTLGVILFSKHTGCRAAPDREGAPEGLWVARGDPPCSPSIDSRCHIALWVTLWVPDMERLRNPARW